MQQAAAAGTGGHSANACPHLQARARLKRLKFHPREALPNVTALARADALYVELTGTDRAVLGECINELRVALEQQGASRITACRERLLRTVSDLDRRG